LESGIPKRYAFVSSSRCSVPAEAVGGCFRLSFLLRRLPPGALGGRPRRLAGFDLVWGSPCGSGCTPCGCGGPSVGPGLEDELPERSPGRWFLVEEGGSAVLRSGGFGAPGLVGGVFFACRAASMARSRLSDLAVDLRKRDWSCVWREWGSAGDEGSCRRWGGASSAPWWVGGGSLRDLTRVALGSTGLGFQLGLKSVGVGVSFRPPSGPGLNPDLGR
jgi:hypothetical protein